VSVRHIESVDITYKDFSEVKQEIEKLKKRYPKLDLKDRNFQFRDGKRYTEWGDIPTVNLTVYTYGKD